MALLVKGGWGLGDGADSYDRKKAWSSFLFLYPYTTIRTVYEYVYSITVLEISMRIFSLQNSYLRKQCTFENDGDSPIGQFCNLYDEI
jgi:hypothetical protein